uniref:Inositol polyphosphate-4-phosphatase type II B n=1 Tax=Pavo cristatus TaxID=9049 RepID=A0A8C9EJZ4_PAVCR
DFLFLVFIRVFYFSFVLSPACKDLVAATRDRKLNTFIQVSVVHPAEHVLTRYSSTEIVEGTRDPLFLTGVTFPPEYPIYEETKIKLTVYDVKDKSQDTVHTTVLPDHKEPRADVGVSNFCLLMDFSPHQQTQASKRIGIQLNLLKNPICKLYRFPTSDNKWMRIREQMAETILSFHVPKELINLHIKEDMRRNQELKDLGELAPHWDNMRKSVIAHCDQMLSMYQDTLAELGKHTGSSFKSSCSKGEKTLEFIPINLHLQRMHVHSPQLKDALYDVITVGAPAAHFQGFKNGGLRKLLMWFSFFFFYSPEEQKSTELFVHAFKDQLVRSALLALYTARPGCVLKKPAVPRNGAEEGDDLKHQDHPSQVKRQDSIPHHSEYDEEEWVSSWNTFEILQNYKDKTSSLLKELSDWYEQLYPLVITLKDCMGEVVTRAKQSMAFVLLQELACGLPQCLMLTLRRDIVFSQALSGLVCGFIIKLHTGLHDQGFLQQLHTVGLLVQYEGLLSTYSEEAGMLEDMAVGISDLQKVMFKVIEAKSEDFLPIITGRRFGDTTLQENINQENLELLKEYYNLFTEKMPPDCEYNIIQYPNVRFTCCKSAKDRTSMSVTLEQCSILRDEHQLHKDFFIRALDCMRSRQTQGALNDSDDPETGCLTDNKPTSRHFYPVALLLVSSHLLVVWLILSLALLLAKYQ